MSSAMKKSASILLSLFCHFLSPLVSNLIFAYLCLNFRGKNVLVIFLSFLSLLLFAFSMRVHIRPPPCWGYHKRYKYFKLRADFIFHPSPRIPNSCLCCAVAAAARATYARTAAARAAVAAVAAVLVLLLWMWQKPSLGHSPLSNQEGPQSG